jgi:hypothetical protein
MNRKTDRFWHTMASIGTTDHAIKVESDYRAKMMMMTWAVEVVTLTRAKCTLALQILIFLA